MEYRPLRTMYAWEADIRGKTKPGQSHKVTLSERIKVWKCLVLPGRLVTATFFLPRSTLITDDFPTFGYPTNPTYILFLLNMVAY
jgi:hypothetical protein